MGPRYDSPSRYRCFYLGQKRSATARGCQTRKLLLVIDLGVRRYMCIVHLARHFIPDIGYQEHHLAMHQGSRCTAPPGRNRITRGAGPSARTARLPSRGGRVWAHSHSTVVVPRQQGVRAKARADRDEQ